MADIEALQTELSAQAEVCKGDKHIATNLAAQTVDICRGNADLISIVMEDLKAGKTLSGLANELKKLADKKHSELKGSSVCITPMEADEVIRKFFGLPAAGEAPASQMASAPGILNLEDFL